MHVVRFRKIELVLCIWSWRWVAEGDSYPVRLQERLLGLFELNRSASGDCKAVAYSTHRQGPNRFRTLDYLFQAPNESVDWRTLRGVSRGKIANELFALQAEK